jgi:hypothetical protein
MALVPAGSIPKALYWDTEDPFHYVRLQRIYANRKTQDLLIIGGEETTRLGRPKELKVDSHD